MKCPECKSPNIMQLGVNDAGRSDLICLDCGWDNMEELQSDNEARETIRYANGNRPFSLQRIIILAGNGEPYQTGIDPVDEAGDSAVVGVWRNGLLETRGGTYRRARYVGERDVREGDLVTVDEVEWLDDYPGRRYVHFALEDTII